MEAQTGRNGAAVLMPAGRPSIYTPELVKRARGYLTNYEDMGDKVPSIAGLACVLGVTRETCRAWANEPDKAEFSVILMELMQRQERALLNGGLGGDFNAPITKMMLTKHGYSDKVENDHTSSDNSMTPQVIERVIVQAKDG
jgi:hypothetical protein